MEQYIFRSAINGFNRLDVTAYIQKSQRESAERAAALEAEIDQLHSSENELRGQLEESERAHEDCAVLLADMTQRCEQAEGERDAALAREETLRREAEEAQVELKILREQLQSMEEEIATARREKENVAQLELEARQRAQALLDEKRAQGEELIAQARAQAQSLLVNAGEEAEQTLTAAHARAEEIRAEMQAQVERTAQEAGELFAGVDTITGHVAAELRKIDVALTQLPLSFDRLEDGLAALKLLAAEKIVTEE